LKNRVLILDVGWVIAYLLVKNIPNNMINDKIWHFQH